MSKSRSEAADVAGGTGPLPPGWAMARLSEAGDWRGGGTPSKSKASYWQGGTIPWVSPKDMKVLRIRDAEDHITEAALTNSAAQRIPAGSVLVVIRSGILEHTLPVAVTDVEIAVNQDLKCLTPHEGFLPSYLAWASRAHATKILGRCSKAGTTVASIETSRLLDFEIPIAPTSEQGRIVDAIESYFTRLDAAVASLQRIQRNLKRYRSSVLKAAVEGRLVPTEVELARAEGRDYEPASVLLERILEERQRCWKETDGRGKYVEPVAPDTSDLPELPDGWCWATVDQLAAHDPSSLADGPFGSNLKTSHYTGRGPRVVRLQNIGDGRFLDERAHISREHFGKLRKHQVLAGDLVIASLGTELPRVAIVPTWLGEAIVKADCIRFAPSQEVISPRYAMHALNSWPTRKRTERLVHGVGRPRIGLTLLRTLVLPLPPRAEQDRIASEIESRLTIAEAVGHAADHASQRSRRLHQCILAWAFSGLLVDQDPADEPASRLLERIRAERQTAAAPSRAKPARGRSRKPRKS